ncbi:hypothetical protein NE235_10715 [Actinoallomurus spadix]|uniref:Major tail protein n=1 Tax=Actinoallomurus spadix TaxID=79912 RepID=A0ABP3GKN8_9ACTN|nr:hypothetical protein [Actinoallomurus spadix]MCO5986574.1 hypothetical protein [Actinoallomurus spadix]
MAATPITRTDRFFAKRRSRIVFCATLANKNSPTRSEINAGTDLTGEISQVNGFNTTSNLLDAPDYGSPFTSKTPGAIEAADSSFQCYQDKTTHDIRELLPRDTTGFVIIMWGGDVPGQLCDVFPVTVSSTPKSLPDNAAADITINFAITSEPAEDVVIPA